MFLDFIKARAAITVDQGICRPMAELALNTGLRIGELGTPKSGRNRHIPLNQAAQVAPRSLPVNRYDRVFCDADGRVRTYRQCNHALERICKLARLKAIQWHALRHTFASHLVMKGIPLKAVQELLGHGTQAMTERYAHLTPDVRRMAVEILDDKAAARWEYTE